MKIDLTYNSTVKASNFTGGATEEAAFKSAMNYVVSEFESLFTNPDTIHVTVGWGTPSHPSDLGHSSAAITSFSYSALKTALNNTAAASGDAAQLAAYATLPSKNPFGSGKFTVTRAEAKALGLISATSTTSDGTVNFNSTDAWSFKPGVAPAAGAYYFIGTAEHELSEILGRLSSESSSGTTASPIDLFRYGAAGVRDKVPQSTYSFDYFSYDKGATSLGFWNNDSNHGDLADWWPIGPAPGGNDSFNDFSNSGVINALSTTDVTLLNVLGWDTAYAPTDIPNGVTGWIPTTVTSAGLNVLSGGYLEVGSGGEALSATVHSGGSVQVDSGGTALLDHINGGGSETVFGLDGNADVLGGDLYVSKGGTTDLAAIYAGGFEDVASGGTASGTSILSGGIMSVAGTAVGTQVFSGGELIVWGAASGTSVDSGGWVNVASGGTDSGTTVRSGGYELVMSKGKVDGATIDGGTLELAMGSKVGSSPIVFGSGGTLKLDQSTAFAGTVSGFGIPDHIDLADIAFGPKTTLSFSEASDNLSGTLTVSDGTHTANIALLGHYVAAQFTMAADTAGGTLIGDPPVTMAHASSALAAPHHG